jgi:PAS domain S-box-containing protein
MFMFNKGIRNKADELQKMGVAILEKQKELSSIVNILELVYDSLPAMIFVKDRENNIIRINKFGAELLGGTKEEIINKGYLNSQNKESADKYFSNDLDVITTGKPKLNIKETLPHEPNRTFLTHKIPLIEGDRITGIIGFSVEITKPLEDCINGKGT